MSFWCPYLWLMNDTVHIYLKNVRERLQKNERFARWQCESSPAVRGELDFLPQFVFRHLLLHFTLNASNFAPHQAIGSAANYNYKTTLTNVVTKHEIPHADLLSLPRANKFMAKRIELLRNTYLAMNCSEWHCNYGTTATHRNLISYAGCRQVVTPSRLQQDTRCTYNATIIVAVENQ